MGKVFKLILITLLIGLGVNLAASFFMGMGKYLDSLRKVPSGKFLLAVITFVLVYAIDTLRLVIVGTAFGYKLKPLYALDNSILGYFFSFLTPMAAGGQPFQIDHLSRLGMDSEKAGSVILSRFVEFLIASVTISLLFMKRIISLTSSVGIGKSLVLAGFTVSALSSVFLTISLFKPHAIGKLLALLDKVTFNKGWGDKALEWTYKLRDSVEHLWSRNPWVVLIDTVLGLSVVMLQAFSLFIVFTAFSSPKFLDIFLIFVFLNLSVYYIPTPGASGGIEGAYTLFYSPIIGDPSTTFSAVVTWRIATYYLQIALGAIWMAFRRYGRDASGGSGGDLQPS